VMAWVGIVLVSFAAAMWLTRVADRWDDES
jgi:hypothetical protein